MNAITAEPSLADLHERLGHSLATGYGRDRVPAGDHRYNLAAPSGLRDLQIDDHIRKINVPVIEDTAFVQQLRLDWQMTEEAIGKAMDRFRVHRNAKRFRAEIATIQAVKS